MTGVATTALPLNTLRRGKVRDVYEVDADRLLLVATDRVSAFDVVMNETVPYKGAVLTQMTAWWLRQIENDVPHHMISADADEIVREVPSLDAHRDLLRGRAMLAWRADVFQVECVIRGYLAGSAWKEYRTSGTLAGEPLRAGLRESDRLDTPLFSPATKAETGHDENITIAHMARIVGDDATASLERLTRTVYARGRAIAEPRGIVIADTKFEFGVHNGRIIIVDEVLTPDSSRFWPAYDYAPGRAQPSFDKQPLRDYLDAERLAGRWSGDYPPPPLPDSVVRATSTRYLDAFRRITGNELEIAELS
ncbi:MAG TPA: phosphoribosylaminoimidazolesuccinocarboxamide synthase [Gemmatimonadaceae bacterium]|nr:phosphoribosylaminoimidazolesuccinocarboxamide synthase [Gemmatimonadaceae bacterium]